MTGAFVCTTFYDFFFLKNKNKLGVLQSRFAFDWGCHSFDKKNLLGEIQKN